MGEILAKKTEKNGKRKEESPRSKKCLNCFVCVFFSASGFCKEKKNSRKQKSIVTCWENTTQKTGREEEEKEKKRKEEEKKIKNKRRERKKCIIVVVRSVRVWNIEGVSEFEIYKKER